ncbi:hypothetical protein MICRO11B_230203 [Micrococcus luteus]|nr:hypothetical protein MICRO116_560006 [Micrococcus sp. 116]VXB42112.1 hypothetical protein MICRO11B_230203 [Micrococcus luteus]
MSEGTARPGIRWRRLGGPDPVSPPVMNERGRVCHAGLQMSVQMCVRVTNVVALGGCRVDGII